MLSENVKHVGNVLKLTRVINFLHLLSNHLPVEALLLQLQMGKRAGKSRERENIIMLEIQKMEKDSKMEMAKVAVIVLLEVIKEMMRKLFPGLMLKLLNSLNRRQNLEKMNGEWILQPLLFKLDKKPL